MIFIYSYFYCYDIDCLKAGGEVGGFKRLFYFAGSGLAG
jgi:hypothetical protein